MSILELPLVALAFAGVIFFAGVHRFFVAAHFLVALACLGAYFVRGAVAGKLRIAAPPLLGVVVAVIGFAYVQTLTGVSCAPEETREALLRYGTAAIVFFLTCQIARTDDSVRRMGLAVAALVAFESLYGMEEHFGGTEQILGWAKRLPGSVSGTYENKDHFAGTLALATPFLVALVQSHARPHAGPEGVAHRIAATLEAEGFWRRAVFFAAALLGALGVLLSASRGGVLALGFGLLVYAGLSAAGGKRSALLAVAGFIVCAGVTTVAVGADPLIARFHDLSDNTRGELSRKGFAKASLRLIEERPLTGFGLGTYDRAFPHVQAASYQNHWLEHAHCDILELSCDLGLPLGMGALGAGAFLIARASRRRSRIHHGLVAGLAAAFAHAFVDFNLQREGSLVFAAFLAGLLFGPVAPALELAGTRARVAGVAVFLALGLSPPPVYAVRVLLAEQLVNPTLHREDDQRSAASRVAALDSAVKMRPEKAPYRLELAEQRIAAFHARVEADARAAAENVEKDASPGVVEALRSSLLESRRERYVELIQRSLADLRAAERSEPLSGRVHGRVALVTLDREEARVAGERAVALSPWEADAIIEAAIGRLKLDREDAVARTWLARGLAIAPTLLDWAEGLASPLDLDAELARALPSAALRKQLLPDLMARLELDLVREQLDALAAETDGVAPSVTAGPASGDVLAKVDPDSWRAEPDAKARRRSAEKAFVLKLDAGSAFAEVPGPGTLVIEASTVPGSGPAWICVLASGKHLGHIVVRGAWEETAFTVRGPAWIELALAAPRHGIAAPSESALVRDVTLRR